MTKNKAWSFSDSPIEVPVNSGSRLKLSVYGAIGNVFDLPILSYYYNCTNGTDVLEFLTKVKEKADQVTDKKLHIILD